MNLFFRTLLVLSALTVLGIPAAHAQATRTWVSGVGDDVNPCSRTAPCKTFAGAISKTAAGGVISVLDPGGFGAVTISKSITIDGGGITGSILGAGTNGILINNSGTDKVAIRNLTIDGAGTGVSGIKIINASGRVTIQNTSISGFTNGIEKQATSTGELSVYDSFINGNTNYGVLINQGKVTLDNVRLSSNGAEGMRVDSTGVSLATVIVRRSVATNNGNVGFRAIASFMAITDSAATNNVYGIVAGTSGVVTVANSTISSNTYGIFADGTSAIQTFGNNTFSRNTTADGTFNGSTLPMH